MKELMRVKLFIVAVPLFSPDMSVEAYYLQYRSGEKLFGIMDDHTALDGAMNSPGLDIINEVGVEPFTGGKALTVPINKFTLISDFTAAIKTPPELLVFALPRDLPAEPMFLDRCVALKKAGYRFAIPDERLTAKTAALYDLADCIMFDASDGGYLDRLKETRTRYPYMRAVFLNVDDNEKFGSLKLFSNSLYEGRFYKNPITKGARRITPIKANALHLLKIMSDEDFSLEEISNVISRDAALSIALLKFINSPTIGIRNKVSSIKNAIALLGQKETGKWIMACVSMYIAEDKPSEITKLSLTRAKFMENLATAFEMGIHAPSLFLMGLFSLLDVILDKPMPEALKEISVTDKIREALAEGRGEFAKVLELVYAYERADWKEVSRLMIIHNVDANKLYAAFFDSLVWYRNLLKSIDE